MFVCRPVLTHRPAADAEMIDGGPVKKHRRVSLITASGKRHLSPKLMRKD